MIPSLRTFPGDLLAEFDAIQQQLARIFGGDWPMGIRAAAPGAFPALNMGTTDEAVEIYAFAPGLDARKIDVSIEKGLLVISGERASDMPEASEKVSVYKQERYSGRFKRAVTLPDDVDASKVEASYRNGVLKVVVPKLAPRKLRRVEVKELEHKQ
ncbi:MAG TPA: Hsp20/alpha crystallin family protein [Usitatibacter sp.]|nr:Hsp20/alpha crystallin family protein [Usitatibacter sp.]